MNIVLSPNITSTQGFEYLYKLEDIVRLNPLKYYTAGCATNVSKVEIKKGTVTIYATSTYPKDYTFYNDETIFKGVGDGEYLVDFKNKKVIYSNKTGIINSQDFSIFPIANKDVDISSWLVLANNNNFYRFYGKDGMGSVAFFLFYATEKLLFAETAINKITDLGVDTAIKLVCYRFGLQFPTRPKAYEIVKVLTLKKGESVIPDRALDQFSVKYFSSPKGKEIVLAPEVSIVKTDLTLSNILEEGVKYVQEWTEVEMDIKLDGVSELYTHQGFLYIYLTGKINEEDVEQQLGTTSDKFVYIRSKKIVD